MGAIIVGILMTPAQAAVRAPAAGLYVVRSTWTGSWFGGRHGDGRAGPRQRLARYCGGVRTAAARGQAHRERAVGHGFAGAGSRDHGASLTPALSGISRDRVGGTLTVIFFVRSASSASWNVANGAQVSVTSGSRASYRLGEGRLQSGTTYEWSARACNAAALCASAPPLFRFTTRT